MNTTRLTVECGAETVHGKHVILPEGTEVQALISEIRAAINSNSHAKTVNFMARCPGAKNPAPYKIDVSDLWLAI